MPPRRTIRCSCSRLDGHMALANSLALKLAGVTKETKDPPGGVIVRDPKTGEPTGVLKDGAEGLVDRVVPDKTFEEKHVAAKAATEHAAQVGVTSVTDMSADGDVGLYQYMLERGELKTRIYAIRSIVSWEALAKTGVRARVRQRPAAHRRAEGLCRRQPRFDHRALLRALQRCAGHARLAVRPDAARRHHAQARRRARTSSACR